MSHASGQVLFLKDNKIFHYEYDGTSDIVCNCLYETYTEMDNNWRKQPWNECHCGKDEEVRIATSYGGGFSWDGRACRNCKSITKGFIPFDENRETFREDGLPDWWNTK